MRTKVIVSGLPGKMAHEAAVAITKSNDFLLAEHGLTGINSKVEHHKVYGQRVRLHPYLSLFSFSTISNCRGKLVVDYTHPESVQRNAEFYVDQEMPFVMGTTGGNKETLERLVANSSVNAVIAPNMAMPIVALQSCMNSLASEHRGLLEGYGLTIVESHQQNKVDTSGTAKAMVAYFNRLGIPFEIRQISMIRDPARQRELGVPSEHLLGHGWHTYTITPPHPSQSAQSNPLYETLMGFMSSEVLRGYSAQQQRDTIEGYTRISPERDVTFKVERDLGGKITIHHAVNGRGVYTRGTLEALRFLQSRTSEKGRTFSMIDVLLSL